MRGRERGGGAGKIGGLWTKNGREPHTRGEGEGDTGGTKGCKKGGRWRWGQKLGILTEKRRRPKEKLSMSSCDF